MRRRQIGRVGAVCGLALGACNAFEGTPDRLQVTPYEAFQDGGLVGTGGTVGTLTIPTDERPAVQSTVAPLPITGGTLLATSDGAWAVASDPERDLVSIVSIAGAISNVAIALEPGDQPGRAVEDSSGHVHVALRGSGSIADIDVINKAVLQRRAVCKAPRGIAFDGATGLLHVACAEGKVVSLLANGGDVVRTVSLPPDLRDVIVRGTELWVTRFKSAEVLRLDAQGTILQTVQLAERSTALQHPSGAGGTASSEPVTLQPEVAWRAVATPNGGAVVVHQDAVEEEINIAQGQDTQLGGSYGTSAISGLECNSIVQNGVTEIGADGAVLSRRGFGGFPLPVDIAVSPDGQKLAVAHAGVMDFTAPQPFVPGQTTFLVPETQAIGVSVLAANGVDEPCSARLQSFLATSPVVSVAFATDTIVLAQVREPPELLVGDLVTSNTDSIPLNGSSDSRLDTGHEIFHRDAGAGIACASCHPEGGEDGHVWQFGGIGQRRTQSLYVGLGATAPFHWNGDLNDLGALMTEVFVGRMGGVNESPDRLNVLTDWLFGLSRPPAIRDASDAAVVRGDALFHSMETGCSTCHSGDHFTDNENVWVGTTEADRALQVPSLVAVGYRAPFLHNGCAGTLLDRFDPACGGGDNHGHTSALTDGDKADLVAYLESL